MVEREAGKRAGRPVLLVGAGARSREVAAVLETLARLGAGDGPHDAVLPPEPLAIADLEELLTRRPEEGVLILESARVPLEDIGFVRRFLERHGLWRLAVLADEGQDARALLQLPRAVRLPWPPDLEQLRSLLSPPSAPARGRERAPPRGASPAATGNSSPGEAAGLAAALVDVGDFVEELLASAALRGENPPRYQFRCSEPLALQRERSLLAEGLSGIVELARRCAGPDDLVSAAVDPSGDAVRIGIEFPLAGLPEKDLPSLFEGPAPGAAAGADPALAEGVAAARHSAAVLREAGERVELFPDPPGRVRCEVRIGPPPRNRPRGAGSTRPSKPEDPFA